MPAGRLNDALGMGVEVDFGQFAVHAGISYIAPMADRRLMMFMAKAALVVGVPVMLVVAAFNWAFGL